MRALTVRQPWAWAIIHGGKDIENRTRNLAGSYRGPVAIHAGLAAFEQHNLGASAHRDAHGSEVPTEIIYGAFIGVVELVDVHECVCDTDTPPNGLCCSSPWAEFPYLDRGDGRGVRPAGHHLVLARPRPLKAPLSARGMLGLWTPSADALDLLQAVLT